MITNYDEKIFDTNFMISRAARELWQIFDDYSRSNQIMMTNYYDYEALSYVGARYIPTRTPYEELWNISEPNDYALDQLGDRPKSHVYKLIV